MNKIELFLRSYDHNFLKVIGVIILDGACFKFTNPNTKRISSYTDFLRGKTILRLAGHNLDDTWMCILILPLILGGELRCKVSIDSCEVLTIEYSGVEHIHATNSHGSIVPNLDKIINNHNCRRLEKFLKD